MFLKRTVPPLTAPITLDESKADLRVQVTAEDALIDRYIQDAVDEVDGPNGLLGGKALVTQTWSVSVAMPDRKGNLELPITPVQSLVSIKYYDANNAEQVLDVADFYLHGTDDYAWIWPKAGTAWPSVYCRPDAITVTFVAGFGDAAAVPASIKSALRLMVSDKYEHRLESQTPAGAINLLSLHRKGWIA